MRALTRRLSFAVLGAVLFGSVAPVSAGERGDAAKAETVAPYLYQKSMNVFRRYQGDPARLFEFYGSVLGFEQLQTYDVGGGQKVARFQIGPQQLKLTTRTSDRTYQPAGVKAATGLRLLTFFFPDEAALAKRLTEHGFAAPVFKSVNGETWTYAFVNDPNGQPVELVVIPNAPKETYENIEVGLTVSDIEASRAFYRSFVGLEELPPSEDPIFGATVYPFRNGTTVINLRSFGKNLPADTGSGGIQYVVTNVDPVNDMAQQRHVTVEEPLGAVGAPGLRMVWLNDPDGITNYFTETGQSRKAQANVPSQ